MILVDNPSNRQMCPVTLFLALAIADGVISDIHEACGLTSLAVHSWPRWTLLPYNGNFLHLPVMRRTGNKSRILSSCPMKPSALDRMMHELVQRAGHQITLATIIQDNRKAAQREKRRRFLFYPLMQLY